MCLLFSLEDGQDFFETKNTKHSAPPFQEWQKGLDVNTISEEGRGGCLGLSRERVFT